LAAKQSEVEWVTGSNAQTDYLSVITNHQPEKLRLALVSGEMLPCIRDGSGFDAV